MTATEELRRMLDERGVEWKCYGYENHTWWGEWHAENRASVNGLFLKVEAVITPAQAIEATLGRGTCEPVDGYDDDGEEIGTCCSECGSPWPVYYVVRYCPVCGCKVVDDASVD